MSEEEKEEEEKEVEDIVSSVLSKWRRWTIQEIQELQVQRKMKLICNNFKEGSPFVLDSGDRTQMIRLPSRMV